MTTFLDASAFVALAGGEPAAAEVEALIRRGDAAMTTLNLAEGIDVLQRTGGHGGEGFRASIEAFVVTNLEVVGLDLERAWRAADLHAARYHRRRSPVSLADCVLIASGSPGDHVASSDGAILRIASGEGLEPIPLPDSRGRRPRL